MEIEKLNELAVVSVRLVKDAPLFSEHCIATPMDAVEVVGKYLCDMDREVIAVLNLRNDGRPLNCHFASMGSINESLTHPRELLKASILSNASAIMLIHNHPGTTLTPSKADTRITDRMAKIGELMCIPLLDHIIVGGSDKEYFSFHEKGILKMPDIYLASDYKYLNLQTDFVAEVSKGKVR